MSSAAPSFDTCVICRADITDPAGQDVCSQACFDLDARATAFHVAPAEGPVAKGLAVAITGLSDACGGLASLPKLPREDEEELVRLRALLNVWIGRLEQIEVEQGVAL